MLIVGSSDARCDLAFFDWLSGSEAGVNGKHRLLGADDETGERLEQSDAGVV